MSLRTTLLALLLATAGLTGCASHSVNGFHRARGLQAGQVEIGGAVSMGRTPGEGAWVARSDRGSDGESTFGVPLPALHFRMGVTERIDAGLETAPGTLRLHVKHAIFDDDRLMMAALLSLGMWSSSGGPWGEDQFEARAPFALGFQLPLATRPLPWLELNVAPTFELMQIYAEREAYLELQERRYTTMHAGFSLGANFAVWRVRINPEVSFLGGYRSDREEGFRGVYPGIGAFIVY